MPYAHVPLPSLAAKQPYDISLRLLLPTSESNFALGALFWLLGRLG